MSSYHLRTLVRIAAAGALVFGAACGDDGSSSGGDGDGDGGGNSATHDGVTLTVRSVQTSTDAIEGSSPDPGDTFVVVELKLENESDDSLPLLAPSFAVKDDDGVEYHGDPLTDLIAGGCESNASVAPDGEATCTVVFAAPEDADLEKVVYEWEEGRVEAKLDGAGGDEGGGGGGAGGPVGTCAQRAEGTYVAAFSIQLIPDNPLYFDAAVSGSEGGLTISLTPLRTPYREGDDNAGIAPMTPVGSAITLHTSAVGTDGAFTVEVGPDVEIDGKANPYSPNALEVTLTLEGRACPDGSPGAFCGTISGEVTSPIPLDLDNVNTFAFNPQDAATLTYDCSGSAPEPF